MIASEQRLDTACGADPGAVTSVRKFHEPLEQQGIQKGQIAGDRDHPIGPRHFQGRVQSAQGARSGKNVSVYRQSQVFEPSSIATDDEDLLSDPLQSFHLTYDDGAAADDEPALIEATEPAGFSAGQDRRCGRRAFHEQSIMTEARVGRLLAACLHQAILDELPQRLDFYENWLHSEGLRDGSIGLAPMTAVLGFLRTEGAAYDRVMARAGRLAADWSVVSLPAMQRSWIAWLPKPLRARAALRVAAGIVRHVSSASRAAITIRKRNVRVDVKASLFCAVREKHATPLCGFYAALVIETLALLDAPATGRVEACHAVEGGTCVIAIELSESAAATDAARAA
jgi:hypothetical protein